MDDLQLYLAAFGAVASSMDRETLDFCELCGMIKVEETENENEKSDQKPHD